MNSVYNWTKTISFVGPKLWEVIPSEMKAKKKSEHETKSKMTTLLMQIVSVW